MGSRGTALLFLTFTLHFHFTRQYPYQTKLDGTYLSQGDILTVNEFFPSETGLYKLHFFSLPYDAGDKVYLGITSREECVWLANPSNPLDSNSSPGLIIDDYGNMKILYNGDSGFISIYSFEAAHRNKIKARAYLTEIGNFVLGKLNQDNTFLSLYWSSFDYASHILLPGMRLGFDKTTGHIWKVTSWTGSKTPTLGSFTLGIDMDSNNKTHLIIWWRGNVYWTSGPLMPMAKTTESNVYSFENFNSIKFYYFSDENVTYVEYEKGYLPDNALIGLNPLGQIYGRALVSCNGNNPASYRGCVPLEPPKCRNPNTYVSMLDFQYGNMSQEGYKSEEAEKLPLYDCGVRCLINCSCIAYSSTTDDNTGCQLWYNGANFVASPDGQPVYFIRDNHKGKSKDLRKLLIASVAGGAPLILISSYICHLLWRKRKIEAKKLLDQKKLLHEIGDIAIPFTANGKGKKFNKSEKTSHEIHIFSFESIAMATNNFSLTNKLGEGGFGPVYKGKLLDGQEIAIKRLRRSSRQGLTEFKNEVKLIAKLQHTNLVRLYGFCIDGEEKMLIYEYMPNKSLDFYIFDSNNRVSLDWKRRLNIIQGIAQGLVYLHKYSRLKVIHRDLKPSNILLDCEMNPKISDFGMARIVGLESEENTNKVVGTYGYMSPEYALNGIVSTKTDVFSFGVLLLEIVSGKKNASCFNSGDFINLIGYAWQLWNEGRAFQLIDPIIKETCTTHEILRCIHIGLLCVQDQARDRPTMLDVVSFLSNETSLQAEPKQPAFFMNTVVNRITLPENREENYSINDVTISEMDCR